MRLHSYTSDPLPAQRPLDENEIRLVQAGVPVFLFVSLLFSTLFYGQAVSPLDLSNHSFREDQEKVYPVLVEQDYAPPPRTDQIRALSDVSAEGQGKLTEKKGFHSLSSGFRFEPGSNTRSGRPQQNVAKEMEKRRESKPDELGEKLSEPQTIFKQSRSGSGSKTQELKIPSNYRFQEDMRLNFDGSGAISLPRQKFEDYDYYRAMLNRIRQSFAPPGANYISRDQFGYTAQQTIQPQVVKTLFLLDESGNVVDIKVIPPVVQDAVAESCVMSLRGQNFGPPPESVKKHGGIIGINFVFPPMQLYR